MTDQFGNDHGDAHSLPPAQIDVLLPHVFSDDGAADFDLTGLNGQEVALDPDSLERVGADELARLGAAPVRCADGSLRVLVSDPTGERAAAVREHFPTEVPLAVVTQPTLSRVLEAANMSAATQPAESLAPAWADTFERVVGLFDDEAGRLQSLRQKLQQLGTHMSEREQRLQQLEDELARMRVEHLRDQETIGRLRHDLAERDGRLSRAADKAQELDAIIRGGGS